MASSCFVSTFLGWSGCPIFVGQLVESSSYCAILHLCSAASLLLTSCDPSQMPVLRLGLWSDGAVSLLLSCLQVDFFGVTTIHVLSLHIVIVVRASTAAVVRLVRASTATPWIRNHKQY